MPTVIDGTDGVSKVDLSEIATGTPSASTFLRGDGAWVAIETTPTTAQVLTATAGASVGAVGTYALLATINDSTTVNFGDTMAGSALYPLGWEIYDRFTTTRSFVGSVVSGTWRCVGYKPPRLQNDATARQATVFLRIS